MSTDSVITSPTSTNEPNLTFPSGRPHGDALVTELDEKLERTQHTLRGHINGGRRSGHAAIQLLHWNSSESIKETLIPPKDHSCLHIGGGQRG